MKEFFESNGIEYALIGGLALNAYGYNRTTIDIDFVTDLKFQSHVIKFLDSLGFELLQKDSAFSLHLLFGKRIDLMYVDGNTAAKLFADAQKLILDDIELPVVSPFHLSQMKAFAASQDSERKQDLNDISELFKRNLVTPEEVRKLADKFGHSEYFRSILDIRKDE